MKKILAVSLILASIFSFNDALSVDYRLDSLTIEDGLLINAVTSILKDSKGFMWFGTPVGLNCYDGYQFRNFKYDKNNPFSLSDNDVSALCEDGDGNLWIGTVNGLNKYDRDMKKFIHYLSDPDDNSTLSGNNISFVYEDNSGTLWIGTDGNGLNRFDRESETFTRFKDDSDKPVSLCGDRINFIYEDKKGTLWICTWPGGLNRYDRERDKFNCFLISSGSERDSSNLVTDIYEDKSGNFWVAGWKGLFRFDRENEKFTRFLNEEDNPNSLGDLAIIAIREDKTGNYWIKTLDGLYLYDPALKKLGEWKHQRGRRIYSAMMNSRSLLQDECGTIWYSAHWQGIYKLTEQNKKFRHIPVPPFIQDYKNVRAIYLENEDIIWMGLNEGLIRFNRKKNEYEFYQPYPVDGGDLDINMVSEICKDREGNLWVGLKNCLSRVEISENNRARFINYTPDSSYPGNRELKNIAGIFEDQSGRLFIHHNNGPTYIFNKDNGSFLQLIDTLDGSFLGYVFFQEESGEYWSSNWKGASLRKFHSPFKKVTSYSVTPSKVEHYNPEPGNPFSLSSRRIVSFFKDRSGTIWLGTQDGGLNKMERVNKEHSGKISERFLSYTTSDGLPTDNVSAIMEDKYGNLWMGSEKGLIKFNPKSEVFKTFDRNDGLWTIDITGDYKHSPSGEMFFATDDGVLAFYPDSIQDNSFIPPVVIIDFRLFNKPVLIGENSPLKKSIITAKKIELPFNQNTLSFEFASLNYINTEKNQYKYMMIGLDDEWTDAGTRRFVEYHRLNPGTYTFRVIGSNNDGVWNTEGASMKIIINPPWWKTLYAYTSYSIFLLLFIYIYVRLRTRRLEKEKIILENRVKDRTRKIEKHEKEIAVQKEKVEKRNKQIMELDQIKTKFFTNVSHEFRTPLTLIQSPVEEMISNSGLTKRERLKRLNMVRRNTHRLLSLVNQLLDISKVDSGKMKLELVEGDIFESLRMITGSFLSAAEAKGIVYNCHIPPFQKHTLFDAEKLEKIVANLLSNAFKFSPEGGEVMFIAHLIDSKDKTSPEMLDFSVADQGPGIPTDSLGKIFDRFYQVESSESKMGAGTGIGLSLTRDLVNLCHGEIVVESELGRGSTFTVKLPLGKDHLNESEYVISKRMEEPVYEGQEIEDVSFESDEPDNNEVRPADIHAKKPIILIVDDNKDIRTHIIDNFADEYSVMEAIDGSAGLKKAIDAIPDLIITDLMMPKMDGLEMCRQLKSDERTSHIPVVMLTARVTLEDRVEGFETGADDYISKPFQMEELKARADNLIEQRRKLRERFSRELTLEPHEITVNSSDEEFLKRAIALVEDHMSDEKFDIVAFHNELNMSHTTLYRKLYSLTNQSPTGFMRTIRIKRAAQLIKQGYGNIARIAYEVGFNNPSYFSKCFKETMGMSPAEYSKS